MDTSRALTLMEIKFIQQVTRKFLFHARAVDNTMLHALNEIATSTVNGTEQTLDATNHFLKYAACNPQASIKFQASNMQLAIHSDTAYLVAPESQSRMGGYHYLTSYDGTLHNGPILAMAKVIINVMGSATEAEILEIYMNAKEAVAIQECLNNLGHQQNAANITTDNSTSKGIVRGEMKQKWQKSLI